MTRPVQGSHHQPHSTNNQMPSSTNSSPATAAALHALHTKQPNGPTKPIKASFDLSSLLSRIVNFFRKLFAQAPVAPTVNQPILSDLQVDPVDRSKDFNEFVEHEDTPPASPTVARRQEPSVTLTDEMQLNDDLNQMSTLVNNLLTSPKLPRDLNGEIIFTDANGRLKLPSEMLQEYFPNIHQKITKPLNTPIYRGKHKFTTITDAIRPLGLRNGEKLFLQLLKKLDSNPSQDESIFRGIVRALNEANPQRAIEKFLTES